MLYDENESEVNNVLFSFDSFLIKFNNVEQLEYRDVKNFLVQYAQWITCLNCWCSAFLAGDLLVFLGKKI